MGSFLFSHWGIKVQVLKSLVGIKVCEMLAFQIFLFFLKLGGFKCCDIPSEADLAVYKGFCWVFWIDLPSSRGKLHKIIKWDLFFFLGVRLDPNMSMYMSTYIYIYLYVSIFTCIYGHFEGFNPGKKYAERHHDPLKFDRPNLRCQGRWLSPRPWQAVFVLCRVGGVCVCVRFVFLKWSIKKNTILLLLLLLLLLLYCCWHWNKISYHFTHYPLYKITGGSELTLFTSPLRIACPHYLMLCSKDYIL